MLFKDEQSGIEINAGVTIARHEVDVKTAKGQKGKKTLTITNAWIGLSHELDDDEIRLQAQSKQHPNDVYSQLQGKRLVFNKILSKIRQIKHDGDEEVLYNTKDLRTAVWRIGEVFAGVRDKSTVFIDLPK